MTEAPSGAIGDFALERDTRQRLSLRALHHPRYGAIHANWLSPDVVRRIAAGKRQPLARACGLRKQPHPHIIDATGGLGRDAFTLAALGARITLIERHPLIFELLQDARVRAIEQAKLAATAQRISLLQADARDWLAATHSGFDAIYLDPMYPDDGKAALPSKEMQILRELTGGDNDADQLLTIARASGQRVVVKRPRHAPPLADVPPDTTFNSPRLRLDVYLPHQNAL